MVLSFKSNRLNEPGGRFHACVHICASFRKETPSWTGRGSFSNTVVTVINET